MAYACARMHSTSFFLHGKRVTQSMSFSLSPPSAPVDHQVQVGDVLFVVLKNLCTLPHSGRILRGLMPYMDICKATQMFLFTERSQHEPWEPTSSPRVKWQELVHWSQQSRFRGVACARANTSVAEVQAAFEEDPLHLVEWAAKRWKATIIQSAAPFRLQPCFVPKPWGREVWLTGIEKRGIALACDAHGSTKLPYALGLFPAPLMGIEGGVEPILLKILEPAAEDSLGDLYLEVHKEKWEVYVVLSVKKRAWPTGEGLLLAGVDLELQTGLQSKSATKWEGIYENGLKKKIEAYQKVRQKLDAWLDEEMEKHNFDDSQREAPGPRRKLLLKAPAALNEQEQTLRKDVEGMLGQIPLKRGDIVSLPPGVLHSLRRGIRVVEFQTPTYERWIAMFNQKTLTQAHWDTKMALKHMRKAPYSIPKVKVLQKEADWKMEQVVDFPQFTVTRLRLNHAGDVYTPSIPHSLAYQLVFVSGGAGILRWGQGEQMVLEAEDAVFLPHEIGKFEVQSTSAKGMSVLFATPKIQMQAASAAS